MKTDFKIKFYIRKYLMSKKFLNLNNIKILFMEILFSYNKKISGDRKAYVKGIFDWLLFAKNISKDGGIPNWFSMRNGWGKSYPEVTGYLISSFCTFYKNFPNFSYLYKHILDMANWEVSIQQNSGGWCSETIDKNLKSVVFNTGQIIDGLVETYHITKDEKYIKSSQLGAEWLLKQQHPEGYYNKNTYMNIIRVFDARVSFALMKLYEVTNDDRLLVSIKKNLDWILTKQTSKGWFFDCDNSITNNDYPLTHCINYTLEGLLYCGIKLKEEKYINAVLLSVHNLIPLFEIKKYLPSRIGLDWQVESSSECLTGNAQLAIILFKLFQLKKDYYYLNTAYKLVDSVLINIDLQTQNKNIFGGVPGSNPLYGNYCEFCYISWASKFILDALFLENIINKKVKQEENCENISYF
ncbi:glycoside hydrolase family 88 protein [Candidatus Gracilibacteria bacterium]|nr:glycoside hydrolase family 88 protein [Candidatus Gracilibacteria bacterium]